MHTTIQILDAISAAHGDCSDYRVGKLLGTSPSAVGNWRNGRSFLSNEYAVKAAALLDWEPAYVIACMERERAEKLEATDEIKATWEKIAQRFKPMAAAILAVMLLAFAPARSEASEHGVKRVTSAIYTLCVVGIARLRRMVRRGAHFWRLAVIACAPVADHSI